MCFKTILACMTTKSAAVQILPASCAIARKYEGHLIGIHTIPALVPYPGIAVHIEDQRFRDFNEKAQEQNDQIKKIFDDHTSGQNFMSEWRSMPARSTRASNQLLRATINSDLVVVAQPEEVPERFDQTDVQRDLIIESGLPVLMVPPNHKEKTIGSSIMLAWNATRGSASALHNGMPFLKQADHVIILTVSSARRHSIASIKEGQEVSTQLSRHGIKSTTIHVKQSQSSVGEQILHEAKANGCDLIVMGAFGHTRLHSFVYGDATHYMLANADLPILFSS